MLRQWVSLRSNRIRLTKTLPVPLSPRPRTDAVPVMTCHASKGLIAYPALTGKQQISTTGGRTPVWSARSGELFFLKRDTVMATWVSAQPSLDWTTPRPLFARSDLAALDYGFAVSGDGRRFLYPARNPDASPREIHVVLNWFEELKAKVAP